MIVMIIYIQSIDLMNRRERRKNKHLLVTPSGSMSGSMSGSFTGSMAKSLIGMGSNGTGISWKSKDRVPTEVIHQQMADMKR